MAAGVELCHSYVDLCLDGPSRRASLESVYCFRCDCAWCSSAESAAVDQQLITGTIGSSGPAGPAELLAQADRWVAQALACEDAAEELQQLLGVLELRHRYLQPHDSLIYQTHGQVLAAAIAAGDMTAARDACAAVVDHLRLTLGHVPSHPLLALQLFTLGDLELRLGRTGEAMVHLEASARALAVCYGQDAAITRSATALLQVAGNGGT